MTGLTQEQLLVVLDYDPDTGIFRWKRNRGKAKIGMTAGFLTSHNYISICVLGKQYMAHRLAWLYVYGEWPPEFIDHINHCSTDNRISNLRSVSYTENNRNFPMLSTNTSGHTGVYFVKRSKKWTAKIVIKKHLITLGLFSHIEDAIAARKLAERNHGFHENHGKGRPAIALEVKP